MLGMAVFLNELESRSLSSRGTGQQILKPHVWKNSASNVSGDTIVLQVRAMVYICHLQWPLTCFAVSFSVGRGASWLKSQEMWIEDLSRLPSREVSEDGRPSSIYCPLDVHSTSC